jgi:hypothetical protein
MNGVRPAMLARILSAGGKIEERTREQDRKEVTMRLLKWMLLFVAASAISVTALPASARGGGGHVGGGGGWHGGGGGWHGGGGGWHGGGGHGWHGGHGGHWHGGWYGGFYLGAALWGWPYYYPYYYPYAYPYAYPYYGYYPYAYPTYSYAVYRPQTVYYTERAPQASSNGTRYWYYCTEPAGYYPYVSNCSKPWMHVLPESVSGPSRAPKSAP